MVGFVGQRTWFEEAFGKVLFRKLTWKGLITQTPLEGAYAKTNFRRPI